MIMYGSTYFFIANSERFMPSERFWGTRSERPGVFSLAGGMVGLARRLSRSGSSL
jgi:hypothetical protein